MCTPPLGGGENYVVHLASSFCGFICAATCCWPAQWQHVAVAQAKNVHKNHMELTNTAAKREKKINKPI